MRIRQVKPEFFADSDIAALPYAVRLFYIGLWCVADDAGWIEWKPERIAHDLYGYEARATREKHVAAWSEALVESGHLAIHECGCAVIPTLPKHQRVTGKQNFRNQEAHGKHLPLTDKPVIAPERSGSGSGTGTVAVSANESPFDGPGDDLQSLLSSWGVIGLPLGAKLTVRLDGLVEDHGADAVRAQFDRLHKAGSKEAGQYVLGACNSLRPIPKKAPDDNSEAIERTRREYPGPVWYPPVKPNGRKPSVIVTDPDTDYDAGMSRDGETKSEPQALAPADWFERPGA